MTAGIIRPPLFKQGEAQSCRSLAHRPRIPPRQPWYGAGGWPLRPPYDLDYVI